jgi:osmotically-inducible protein OsmY
MAGSKPSRGPKGYSRSDDRIEDEVCERVARSGVESDDIEVKVEHREVTLTGTVGSREEKWWLESLVDDVFGVEEVHNRLRVQRDLGERSAAERSDPSAGKGELPH